MDRREKWTNGDYAAAMVRYVAAHAKYHEKTRDGGIQSEAFHRGGDNPSSLRVWSGGTWADARNAGGGGALEFARVVAGQSLPDFMGQWFGGVALEAKPQRAKQTLPPHAALAFARMTISVADSPTSIAWLERRGLASITAALDTRKLARAITPTTPIPSWAKTKLAPWTSRHHLVVALYDGLGVARGLHARKVVDDGVDDVKVASPAGFTTSGLVMANAAARAMFAKRAMPASLRIVEGLPAYLGTAASDSLPDNGAVVGHLSGGWCDAHAAAVPDGTVVVVDVDPDKAGEKYAVDIATTFIGRDVKVVRAIRSNA